jgi:hypothetical protein
MFEQQFNTFSVAFFGGVHKRRHAGSVVQIEIGVVCDE